MGSVTGPAHLEIEIDEWQAAQEKVEAVSAHVTWRGARDDPALAALFAGIPAGGMVRINLHDGRTELAPKAWKGLRFGKGPSIYESARSNYEAWSDGRSFLQEARDSEMGRMIRRLVPDFDSYTNKEQVDFIVRTHNKIDAVRKSADDLANHLEYATSDKHRAVSPLKDPALKVRAAVFSDMTNCRSAGELLGVPHKDKDSRNENQTVRKAAELGRALLQDYYDKSEYEAMIDRMRRYHRWWGFLDSIEDPRQQVYVLLAKARNSSAEQEKIRGDGDGFAEKLDEWVRIVERRLEAAVIYERCQDPAEKEEARLNVNQLVHRQMEVEATDNRFGVSLSVLEAPPASLT